MSHQVVIICPCHVITRPAVLGKARCRDFWWSNRSAICYTPKYPKCFHALLHWLLHYPLPPPQVIMLVVPVPLFFAWPFYTFMGSISCFSHFSRFLPQVSESPILRIISPWFVDETSATCYMLYIVVPWTEDDGGLVRSVSNSKNYSQWTASYNAEFQGSRIPFTQVRIPRKWNVSLKLSVFMVVLVSMSNLPLQYDWCHPKEMTYCSQLKRSISLVFI